MVLAVGVSAGVLLAMLLVVIAMRHKSLLDPEVEREMIKRLETLAPAAQSRWGRMSAAGMLHHVAAALRMATGDLHVAPRMGPLRLFPLKQLIIFVLPFPKGAPTAAALLSSEEPDFETGRAAVRAELEAFAKREVTRWPDHPAFGPLRRDQWGVLAWKHVDHHFRQFGV